MKKILSLVLALIFVCLALVGCKKENEVPQDTSVVSDTVSTDSEFAYDPVLDTLNFEGMEINFLVSDFEDAERKEFFGEESSDSVVSAIYRRNNSIEQKFNVKLLFTETFGADILQDVRNLYNTNDATVDIIGAYEYYGMGLAAEGMFSNLHEIEYLNPQSPWWNQSWNETCEYSGALFAVAGDINTSIITKTQVTFVNNNLLKDSYPTDTPDLYAVVRDNKWTIEYIKELSKNVYIDNGLEANTRDLLDRYGLVVGSISQPSQALLAACGYQWSVMGADNKRILTLDTERNLDIFERIRSLFDETKEGIFVAKDLPGVYYYATIFAKNNSIFSIAPMFTAERLAATDIDYSILPIPKYDEAQENYYSSTQDSHTFCAVFTMSDAKSAVGAVLEYMGYLSKKDVVPGYFETFYKAKYASNPETMQMFDSIVESIHFDFIVNWSRAINDILKKVRAIGYDPLKEPVSEIASFQDSCQKYLDSTYDLIEAIYGQ